MNKKEKTTKFSTMKDLFYIITIFILTFIYVLSHVLINLNGINSKLSFAGTIISIILSVIAIIYTLVESIGNSNVQVKLNDTSDEIINLTDHLNESIDKLTDVSVKLAEMGHIAEELTAVREDVKAVKESNEHIYDRLKDANLNSDNTSINDRLTNINWTNEVLSICLWSYKKNLNLISITSKYISAYSENDKQEHGMIMGAIFIFDYIELITLNFDDKKKLITVKNINSELLSKLENSDHFGYFNKIKKVMD